MFGAMLSPESGGAAIDGGGVFVWLVAGTAGTAGAGFVSEVLQPANIASVNAMVAATEIVCLSENIVSFVSHSVVTNKFQN